LRLRNISGIIIVDFIDMPKYMEEELVRTMQEELNHDSTQSTVIDMTGLGLMEITRRRTGKPLHEALK
jgi:ribonuclease G